MRLKLVIIFIWLITLVSTVSSCACRRPIKPVGCWCKRHDQCNSGCCSWTLLGKRCRECCSHGDCGPDEYCRLGKCKSKKENGDFCGTDSRCKSGHCCGLYALGLGICRQCCNDKDCDSGHYCAISPLWRRCVEQKCIGQSCWRNGVCKSDHCCWGKCRECCKDSHCGKKRLPLALNHKDCTTWQS